MPTDKQKPKRRNHGGNWKGRFLAALARTGIVKYACDETGIDRSTAYRAKLTDGDFSDSWNEAVEIATEALEIEARRRAHDGVEKPIFYQGAQCGSVREYSDTLLIFTLKALNPAKYREPKSDITVNLNESQAADPATAEKVLAYAATLENGERSKLKMISD